MTNPFVTNGYVSADLFCDREKETQTIISAIQNGNNLTLISTRRMGKSGLIQHCFNHKDLSNYNRFFVDIYATKCLNDFVFVLGQNIIKQLKPFGKKFLDTFLAVVKSLQSEVSYDSNGIPLLSFGLGKINNATLTLDEIFQYLRESKTPCVVAIDEFQQITKYPESNTEALLRTYIQQTPLTHFIFSGSQRHIMGEMFSSASRPFFASTSMLYLEPIEIEKYIEFAQRHFQKAGKSIQAEVVQKIHSDFEGITWYIQKILNRLFESTEQNSECKVEDIEVAVADIVDSLSSVYADFIFQMPDKQYKLLIAIAKDHKVTSPTSSDFVKRHNLVSASSVQAALKGLLEKEFATHDQTGYAVYDRFFEKFLNSNF